MRREMKTIAIAGGAGGVGSSLAFNLLLRPEPYDVVVVDRRPQKVLSHVMDLEQVPALLGVPDRLTLQAAEPATRRRAGGPPSDLSGGRVRAGEPDAVADADVVVICAGAPLTENTSRSVYLRDNAAIVSGIAERLGDALVVVVTNPVDALCTWLVGRHGLDRRRVLGYTLNDSLRLRTAVAAARGVAPADVGAYVLGEHGDAAVPVFSRVTVRGEPVTLDAAERAAADAFVRTWYRRHVALDSRRSSTWTSGAGLARMVAGLSAGADPWPASVVLDGEYGIAGAAVTVPVALGPGGAERIHEWDLAPDELAALRRAAESVSRAGS
jgi:malate dehydrogenase